MSLRTIPESMHPASVAEVDSRLEKIRREHAARILLAVESGSRAWGFPSPDSDYDCRFIYLRRREAYVSLFPKRDVIETPLIGEMDVNGWDIAKALKLLLKGNAVVIEWLTSPIVYEGNAAFRDDMLGIASRIVDRNLVARHYLHLGERQRKAYFPDGQAIALKKIFYALRPAAALRWLRLHPDRVVAPMHFPTLIEESDVSPEIASIVSHLIAQKSRTRELGKGLLPEVIGMFIDSEFEAARLSFLDRSEPIPAVSKVIADDFFREILARFPEAGDVDRDFHALPPAGH